MMTNYLSYMGMVGRFIDGMYDGDTRNFESSISRYLYRFLLVVETILYKQLVLERTLYKHFF